MLFSELEHLSKMGTNQTTFLETRDMMMSQLGWNRRVATLAARLLRGVDTWEGIRACITFVKKPLLSVEEAIMIRDLFQRHQP